MKLPQVWSRIAALVFVALIAFTMFDARAENHALIMWIGEYADPGANLPGIELDAKRARQIALTMNIAASNIIERKNKELTRKGMADAMAALTDRIAPGDKVFLYYSGHGGQKNNTSAGKKCSEGLISHDLQLYFDKDIEVDLARLGAKASQVVMLNDSCFSGGASEKGLKEGERKLVAKRYLGPIKVDPKATSPSPAGEYRCGDAVNKGILAKNFEVVQRKGANLLYVAAARDNEVSYASPEGSLATEAWAACLADPSADTDKSGSISGEELRACAQRVIDGNGQQVSQHITLTGTTSLAIAVAPVDPRVFSAVSAPNALRDIAAGSDKSYAVKLTPVKNTVRIGQDSFEFKVETNREGYLYILQVGSDGKTFNLLFPNQVDTDNRIGAGTQKFPRPSWALRSAGPAGTNHLMALLSATPKDFAAQMGAAGVFASAPATRGGVKSLVVVATGASPAGEGRYGASPVVQLVEAP